MTYKLFIQINTGNEDNDLLLKEFYTEQINKLNNNKNNEYKDSGFDLYCVDQIYATDSNKIKIDLGIKCAVYKYNTLEGGMLGRSKPIPSAYYLYPRSSISKTNLRLANSVGIIDSGYRGNIKIALDNVHYNHKEQKWTPISICHAQRLVQICMPDLSSDFTVEIIDRLNDTDRGSGGFGSTGK